MSAVVGAACCCTPPEPTPCNPAEPLVACPPVGIILEGKITIAFDVSYEALRDIEHECGYCDNGGGGGDGPVVGPPPGDIGGNPNDPPVIDGLARLTGQQGQNQSFGAYANSVHNSTTKYHTTVFYSVSFKTLLKGSGPTYSNIGAVQNEYPSVHSVIGAFRHTGLHQSFSSSDDCINCGTYERRVARDLLIEMGPQEDPFLDDYLKVTRSASYYECPYFSGNTECVLKEFGEGCYETFEVDGFVNFLTEVTLNRSAYQEETDIFNCTLDVVEDTQQHGVAEEVIQQERVKMKRWHKIEDPWDICPQSSMRPFTATTGPFPSDLCGSCNEAVPDPCECWTPDRYGYPGGVPDIGGYTIHDCHFMPYIEDEFGEEVQRFGHCYAAPVYRCHGMGTSELHSDIATASESFSISCDEEISQCIIATDKGHDCFGDICGLERIISMGVKSYSASNETKADTIQGFEITRYEILSELPDPAVWPNV